MERGAGYRALPTECHMVLDSCRCRERDPVSDFRSQMSRRSGPRTPLTPSRRGKGVCTRPKFKKTEKNVFRKFRRFSAAAATSREGYDYGA